MGTWYCSSVTAQDSFQTLKAFFESREVARQAMRAIKEGAEIGVIIGGAVDCALFRQGENPVVEARPARQPDVVFHIQPETVDVLSKNTKDQIGEVGVSVLNEVLAGNIRIEVPGRIWNLLNRGYLDMIKHGGAPVAAFLGRQGLSSVSKITTAIKKMKG